MNDVLGLIDSFLEETFLMLEVPPEKRNIKRIEDAIIIIYNQIIELSKNCDENDSKYIYELIITKKVYLYPICFVIALYVCLARANGWTAEISECFSEYLKANGWEVEYQIVEYHIKHKNHDVIKRFCSEHILATEKGPVFLEEDKEEVQKWYEARI